MQASVWSWLFSCDGTLLLPLLPPAPANPTGDGERDGGNDDGNDEDRTCTELMRQLRCGRAGRGDAAGGGVLRRLVRRRDGPSRSGGILGALGAECRDRFRHR